MAIFFVTTCETTVLLFNFITNRTRRKISSFLRDEYTRQEITIFCVTTCEATILLFNFITNRTRRKISSFFRDEYTRQEITIFCVTTCEATVLFFNFITDRTHGNAKYRHFFVTSILVENSQQDAHFETKNTRLRPFS